MFEAKPNPRWRMTSHQLRHQLQQQLQQGQTAADAQHNNLLVLDARNAKQYQNKVWRTAWTGGAVVSCVVLCASEVVCMLPDAVLCKRQNSKRHACCMNSSLNVIAAAAAADLANSCAVCLGQAMQSMMRPQTAPAWSCHHVASTCGCVTDARSDVVSTDAAALQCAARSLPGHDLPHMRQPSVHAVASVTCKALTARGTWYMWLHLLCMAQPQVVLACRSGEPHGAAAYQVHAASLASRCCIRTLVV